MGALHEMPDACQQQPGEKSTTYSAFLDYARMGPTRSLTKLVNRYKSATETPPTKRIKTLKDWSRRGGWQARVAEWDRWQHTLDQEAWEERKDAVRQKDWEQANALRNKALELLDKLDSDNASLSQVAQALRVASELQRLAVNEPTHDWNIRLNGAALDAAIEQLLDQAAVGLENMADAS